jgi:hypothetical protein
MKKIETLSSKFWGADFVIDDGIWGRPNFGIHWIRTVTYSFLPEDSIPPACDRTSMDVYSQVATNPTTWCHIKEELNLHRHCCKNLKSGQRLHAGALRYTQFCVVRLHERDWRNAQYIFVQSWILTYYCMPSVSNDTRIVWCIKGTDTLLPYVLIFNI